MFLSHIERGCYQKLQLKIKLGYQKQIRLLFSVHLFIIEKIYRIVKEEDYLGLVPKYGCFEMHVKSRQIVVSKSGRSFGNCFWNNEAKNRSSYMSLMPSCEKKKRQKTKEEVKRRDTEKTKKAISLIMVLVIQKKKRIKKRIQRFECFRV